MCHREALPRTRAIPGSEVSKLREPVLVVWSPLIVQKRQNSRKKRSPYQQREEIHKSVARLFMRGGRTRCDSGATTLRNATKQKKTDTISSR
ncbi:hypothetical protein JTE90_014960 [Oedothorax gibbosus]|uniref:Uncharacterized protein n=1 Tax=Oedothorax gibbosus TaxID=931172 RepID=A0AAV6UWY0_9ARAC|nr:hypothetical protein JTE90_014960 [Oedothorax gibbosus]